LGVRRAAEIAKDLAGHEALEAADDLWLALSLGGASFDAVEGRLASAHAHDDHTVEGGIGLPVAAAVEPVSAGLAAGGRDRADAT
jgi:hypothetical protein